MNETLVMCSRSVLTPNAVQLVLGRAQRLLVFGQQPPKFVRLDGHLRKARLHVGVGLRLGGG